MTGSDIRKLLSQNIKYFREIRRLSQADLAYEANISIPFLSDIERGNKWPHPDTLASIATTLQVEPVDLFTPKYTTDSETKTLTTQILNFKYIQKKVEQDKKYSIFLEH